MIEIGAVFTCQSLRVRRAASALAMRAERRKHRELGPMRLLPGEAKRADHLANRRYGVMPGRFIAPHRRLIHSRL
jgi:hypothetical protein